MAAIACAIIFRCKPPASSRSTCRGVAPPLLGVPSSTPSARSSAIDEGVAVRTHSRQTRLSTIGDLLCLPSRCTAAQPRTMLCLALETRSDGKLMFCNAGHNPPLIYGVDGLRRIETGGMPVGLFEMAPYSCDTLTMKPGDTLVLYSDGVTEAQNLAGEEFGEARLVAGDGALHPRQRRHRARADHQRRQGIRPRRRTV